MLLLLGENLARFEAGHPAFHDRNRRVRRLRNRSRGESFRQRHHGSGEKSNHYHVDRFSRRTVHEYAEDVNPALDRSQPDLRACNSGFKGDRQNWKAHRAVLSSHHSSCRCPRDNSCR